LPELSLGGTQRRNFIRSEEGDHLNLRRLLIGTAVALGVLVLGTLLILESLSFNRLKPILER
jgi:hypothetical protein